MKKFFVVLLVLTLALCAACGRRPQPSEQPETPEQPGQEQTVTPEAPDTPENQEPTALEGPEGCQILMAVKPEDTLFLRQRAAFLDGRTVAMAAPVGSGQQVQIVELVEGKVLSTFDLPGSYGETGRSVRLSAVTDKYHLSCHDGTDLWSILVDADWQMEGWTVQPVEPELPTQWQMGSHTVTQNDEGSVLVDGQVVLQGDRVVMAQAEPGGLWYGITAVLDDHRLLVSCGGAYESEYKGIYDHETGETWTFGQKCGQMQQLDDHRWILYHNDHLRCYDLAFLDTDTETLTPLDTGFETIGTSAEFMEMNVENTRLALANLENGQAVIKVYDLTNGQLLYHWSGPMSAQWLWAKPVGGDELVILTDRDGRSLHYPVPQTPEAPQTFTPEGAVAERKLPGIFEGSLGVDLIAPLEGSVAALRSFDGGTAELLIYDVAEDVLLSRQEVPGHDGTNELLLLGKDPYTLYYYDGQDEWKITLDGDWQQTREDYDPALYLSVMGDLMIHQSTDGSIAVGRVVPPALQANDRMTYRFVRVLNDHQLLYQAVDKTVSTQSHYGVYDSITGETQAVTTMGQQVVGSWGDLLLVARKDSEGLYQFAVVSLTDFAYTPLEIGHETPETGVDGTRYGDAPYIQCDSERRRLLLIGYRNGVCTAEVVSLEDSRVLYRLEVPDAEIWTFYLAEDDFLLVRKGWTNDSTLWLVECGEN